MKPKTTPAPETPAPTPPAVPETPPALKFSCLPCGHEWEAKAKPAKCPACRSARYWLPTVPSDQIPKLFYDGGANAYLLPLPSGDFLKMDATNAKLHLKRAGAHRAEGVKHLSAIEEGLASAQLERNVVYAGALSGWKRGEHYISGGERILVTSAPKLPVAKKGEWVNLQNFFLQITDGNKRQYQTLLAWLATARRHQLQGSFAPAHVLGVAGNTSDGKSFLAHVIRYLLGGQEGACPLDYFKGDKFNDFLAERPLWLIDDKAVETTFKARVQMGANLKAAAVVPTLNVRGLYRKMFVVSTFRRVVINFNVTAESVAVFPELTPDIRDKGILIHSGASTLSPEREDNQAMLDAELPGLCYYLDRFEIPAAMKRPGWCQCPVCKHVKESEVVRFGFYAYHDCRITSLLSSIAADENLWAIIRQVLATEWKTSDAPWLGTSEELEREIDATSFRDSKTRLTGWQGGFRSTVGKIAAKGDGRIVGTVGADGLTRWKISKP